MAKPIANAGSDKVIAEGSLPQTPALAGSGTPGTGGTSITGYQWAIARATVVGPTFSSATAQNPTFGPVAVLSAFRLFLVVTDDLGNDSETNPLLAPESAFCNVYVTTAVDAIPYIAPGSREWWPYYHTLVDAVASLRTDLDGQTIADHDTSATGSELDTLTDGSDATGLHTHADAATSTKGFTQLAEAAVSAASPKAVTRDDSILTQAVPGTLTSSGFIPGGVLVPSPAAGSEALAHFAFPEARTVVSAGFRFADGGSGTGSYTFRWYSMTLAQFGSNDWAGATALGSGTITITPGSHAVRYQRQTINTLVTPAASDDVLALRCTAAPSVPGAGLVVDVELEKRW